MKFDLVFAFRCLLKEFMLGEEERERESFETWLIKSVGSEEFLKENLSID